MTAVTAAAVRTAAVTFFMVMVVMIAAEICPDFESAVGKIFSNSTDIAFCTADNHDIGTGKSIDCAAPDTAANKNINPFIIKKFCQCAMS